MTESNDDGGGIDPDLLVFDEEELRRLTAVDVGSPEPADEEEPPPPAEPDQGLDIDHRPPGEYVLDLPVEDPPAPELPPEPRSEPAPETVPEPAPEPQPEPPPPPPEPDPHRPSAIAPMAPPPPPPPPDVAADPTTDERRTRRGASRRVRIRLAILAGLMVLLATVSILAQRGDLDRWTKQAGDRLDAVLREDRPEPDLVAEATKRPEPRRSRPAPEPDPFDGDRSGREVDANEDGRIAVNELPTVEAGRGEPWTAPAGDSGHVASSAGPTEVEIAGRGTVVLQPGEVLIELKNGNFLQGRLLKLSERSLTIILESGRVDVALERLKSDEIERYRSLRHLRVRTLLLKSGERVQGRVLEVTDAHVDMLFPTARVVFQRSEVEKIER